MPPRLRHWFAIAAVLTVAVVLFPPFLCDDDSYDYVSMAEGRRPFPIVPYARRVLTPWLASWFPEPFIGFEVLTVAALAAAAVLFLVECEQLGLDSTRRFFALALLMTLPQPVAYLLQNRWMVDPLLLVFWIAGIGAILARRDLLLCCIIAVGTLNKEVAILLGAVWFAFHVERNRFAATALRAALISLPGVVVLVLLALAHPAPVPQPLGLLASVWDQMSLRSVNRSIVTAGLPLALVLIWRWRGLTRDLKRLMTAGTAAVLPLTLIATATERMLGLAAPFWIPAVVEAFTGWQVALICAGDLMISRSVILTQDAWMRPLGLIMLAVAVISALPATAQVLDFGSRRAGEIDDRGGRGDRAGAEPNRSDA